MDSPSAKGAAPWHEGLLTGAVVSALAMVLLSLVWRRLLIHLRLVRALWSIPGPLAYPIIGNALMLVGGIHVFFQVLRDGSERYGRIFRLWIGPYPYLVLCGAEELQPILSSSVEIEKSEEYRCMQPWLSTGLLTGGGSKWHTRRKLLTGAFHSTVLESYVTSLDHKAGLLISKINSLILEKSFSDWSEGIEVEPLTKLCALDAICETIMGFSTKALEGTANTEYVNAINRVTSILQRRFITPWLRPNLLFNLSSYGREFNKYVKVIHNFTQKVIRERKEELKFAKHKGVTVNGNECTKRKSFLDLLLKLSEDGQILSDEDIREEVDTFMFAGHDTTAAALNWSLFALGNNPDIQERLLEEERTILGGNGDGTVKTIAQLGKLEYLDCFVKEVLRMFPSVPLIGRELQSPLTIKGKTFPAKTMLALSIFILHRDPIYFPNPDKFDPDRFMNSTKNSLHPYGYIPFSGGSRNCIGQKFAILELKMVIRKILQNFELKSLQSIDDVTLQSELILSCPDGIKIAFRKRGDDF